MERSKKIQKSRRKKAELGQMERRGLIQMAVSLLLFLMVFAGQEAFPEQAVVWREELSALLRRNTDFRQVFLYVGESVAEEAPVLETLDTVWTEVFGGGVLPMEEPDRQAVMSVRLELRQEHEPPVKKPELPPVPEKPPEAGDPVLSAVQQELGLSESVTPVLGVLTSGFGVREHPIDGESKMHDGVDIAADSGVDILAFADATVDYIGESPAYGMYLQLRHDNGVTTFYAHCSELCVRKGMTVKRGDVVAKVGDTGNTTGPHLHFEIKKDGKFMDPLLYIHYLTE